MCYIVLPLFKGVICMSTITIRLNEEIEDEFDMKVINEYEENVQKDSFLRILNRRFTLNKVGVIV